MSRSLCETRLLDAPVSCLSICAEINIEPTATGTLTNAAGGVIGTVTNAPGSAPVAAAAGTCSILDLTLPLHLNLLGLIVDLNQVHLTITAQQGSSNLFGNLLCAIANLLHGDGPLGSLAGLVNNILQNLWADMQN